MAFGIDDVFMIGFAAAGTALNIFGQSQKHEAEKQQALAQADDAEIAADRSDKNAGIVLEQTVKEVRYLQRQNKLALGDIRAAYGASGLTMDGTPQEYVEQQEAIGIQNWLELRYKGVLQANSYRDEAYDYRRRASGLRQAAANSDEAALLGMLEAGLAGAGELAKTTGVAYRRSTLDRAPSIPTRNTSDAMPLLTRR